jgi:hypothetical protein
MSFAVAYLVSTALTGCLVWAVAKWAGFALPLTDLALIIGLCNGLALLPRAGWVLGMAIMALLLLRTTDADTWPDTVVTVTGSGFIWVFVNQIVMGLWSY